MVGTYINIVAIVIGTTIGLFLRKGLKERYKVIVMQVLGLSTMFIGMSMTLGNMFKEESEPLLFILSLVIGGIIGEWIDIDDKLNKLGEYLKRRVGGNDGNFVEGFVTASLVYCVGTMAVLGSLNSGLYGDHDILKVKSVLDGVMSLILASTFGIGVYFSILPVFVYQGAITLFAATLEPFITTDMIREITIVGGIMIFGLGLNFLELIKMKVANLLPAIVLVVLYYVALEPLILIVLQ